jgi:hypothetical protein
MLFIVLGEVNKYPQCSCIYVYFGSIVILRSIHMCGFSLIISVQVGYFIAALLLFMITLLSFYTNEEQ